MTIKQILTCELPEGKYHDGMVALKNLIADPRLRWGRGTSMDSLCASFSALYEIANGRFEHSRRTVYRRALDEFKSRLTALEKGECNK